MTSNAVAVEVQQNPLKFTTRTNTRRLATVLSELATTVSRNAKCLQRAQAEIVELRKTIVEQDEQNRSKFLHSEKLRAELETEVNQNRERIQNLEATASRKDELKRVTGDLQREIGHAKNFIKEIEEGSGERVTRFVSQYIADFVPRWYDGVRSTLWKEIKALLAEHTEAGTRRMETRVARAEDKTESMMQQAQADTFRLVSSMSEERKQDTAALKASTDDKVQHLSKTVDRVATAAKEENASLRSTTTSRFEVVESEVNALHKTLCFDKEMCREVAALAGDKDDSGHLAIDYAVRDPRVQAIAQTPHFSVLRASVQKELGEKVDGLKSDLHQDFLAEILDVHRELKGKIGTGKFGDLLAQYRDTELYANVRGLMSDVAELRNTKVDGVQFTDALKSKADTKGLQGLVERNELHTTVDTVSRRVEEMEHMMVRVQESNSDLRTSQLRLQVQLQLGVGTGSSPPMAAHPAPPSPVPGGRASPQMVDVLRQRAQQPQEYQTAAQILRDEPEKPPTPESAVVEDQRDAAFAFPSLPKQKSKPRRRVHSAATPSVPPLVATKAPRSPRKPPTRGRQRMSEMLEQHHENFGSPNHVPMTQSQQLYCEAISGTDPVALQPIPATSAATYAERLAKKEAIHAGMENL